jgi:peptide/nickel transport system ATP-binding protein
MKALDKVSLQIPHGGYSLGVVGESGSGKTTLGLSILNLIEPPGKILKGSVIEYEGKKIQSLTAEELRRFRWKEVAMVYQSAMNSLNPVKPISHPIMEVIHEHTNSSREEARDRALSLLSEVGIPDSRVDDYPHEFSGGMKQRVVIALALALSPKVLIADEPTSALDVVVQKQILKLLKKEVVSKKLNLIFITHEISILSGAVENIAVMLRGEIVELGPIQKVFSEPLHPYTQMLISTLLTMDSSRDLLQRAPVENSYSAYSAYSSTGCKYSDRCKYVFERCIEHPQLIEVQTGRWVACHKY